MDDTLKKFFMILATDIVDGLVEDGYVDVKSHLQAVGSVVETLESQTEKIKKKSLDKD